MLLREPVISASIRSARKTPMQWEQIGTAASLASRRETFSAFLGVYSAFLVIVGYRQGGSIYECDPLPMRLTVPCTAFLSVVGHSNRCSRFRVSFVEIEYHNRALCDKTPNSCRETPSNLLAERLIGNASTRACKSLFRRKYDENSNVPS